MPTWKELKKYLDRYGELRRVGKHYIYSYRGGIVRVSHGGDEIGAKLWRDILKHELHITQEEFNAGIK